MNTMLTYTIEGDQENTQLQVEVLSEDKIVNVHIHGWDKSLTFTLDRADVIKDLGSLFIEASTVAEE
tara:strand:- start:2112 stop:2312 length:201 start_codon:yes stop_codon:yes gene_type:complete